MIYIDAYFLVAVALPNFGRATDSAK
ncbi:hypothetical protein NB231_09758 [Nitrococcus mobilis Nb-231]|uniref:Uncharacterized protein n=1 Tax=Nitrococcus mobilis Nb-231 TaxID=314278 RepID=A4BNC9_9GAMM|nr:hypothetical protein NB231_09758 [Nitrococcus mobilis Nb-231]